MNDDGEVVQYVFEPNKDTPRKELVAFFENFKPVRWEGMSVWVYPDRVDYLETSADAVLE